MFRRPLILLAILTLSVSALASVVAYETIDDMARRVPLIVRGKVLRTQAGWDESHRRIWTWTEVAVTEAIKGKAQGIVLVKQPGGEVEAIGQSVAGAATFREGEECVLFLEPAPDEKGAWRVSGLSAGKVQLIDDRGQPTAVRVTDGLSFAATTGTKVKAIEPRELLGTPTQFITRLRAANGGAK